MEAKRLFISYTEQDQPLVDILETHLSSLKRRGLVTIWHARKITAGQDQAVEIDAHFDAADIILLCISADFLASDYYYGEEMRRALERHKASKAYVIPILLRSAHIVGLPFTKLTMLPTNGKPVLAWSNRDDAFVNIAQGVEQAITGNYTKPNPSEHIDKMDILQDAVSISCALCVFLLSFAVCAFSSFPLYQRFGIIPLALWIIVSLSSLSGLAVALRSILIRRQEQKRKRRSEWVRTARYAVLPTEVPLLPTRRSSPSIPLRSQILRGIIKYRDSILISISFLLEIFLVQSIWVFFLAHLPLFTAIFLASLGISLVGGIVNGVLLYIRTFREIRSFFYYRTVFEPFRSLSDTSEPYLVHYLHNSYDQPSEDWQRQDRSLATLGVAQEVAMVLVSYKKYERACSLLKEVSILDPQSVIYVTMGNLLLLLQRYEEALSAYKSALDLHPTYALAYEGMYKTLKHLGEKRKSAE